MGRDKSTALSRDRTRPRRRARNKAQLCFKLALCRATLARRSLALFGGEIGLGGQTGQNFGEQFDAFFGGNVGGFDLGEKVFDQLEERFDGEVVQLEGQQSHEITRRSASQQAWVELID